TRSKRDWSSDVCSSDLTGLRALRGVHDLGQLVARLLHLLGRSLDSVDVGALERALRLGDGLLGLGLHVGRRLVAQLLQRLLGGRSEARRVGKAWRVRGD